MVMFYLILSLIGNLLMDLSYGLADPASSSVGRSAHGKTTCGSTFTDVLKTLFWDGGQPRSPSSRSRSTYRTMLHPAVRSGRHARHLHLPRHLPCCLHPPIFFPMDIGPGPDSENISPPRLSCAIQGACGACLHRRRLGLRRRRRSVEDPSMGTQAPSSRSSHLRCQFVQVSAGLDTPSPSVRMGASTPGVMTAS